MVCVASDAWNTLNMKKLGLVALLPLLAATSACTSTAINRAGNELADTCEAMAPDTRISAPRAESRGGMFGHVMVTGICLSPEEDGYEDAMTIEEYRASIAKKRD